MMHRIRTIATASIHTYFDVCPESPDGRHLCWFHFDGQPLDSGTVMIGDHEGGSAIAVQHCAASPHDAARQGWLDQDHVYFSAQGQVHIADLNGKVVQRVSGAINTIHKGSRSGLTYSAQWARAGGKPDKEACYRVDLDDGRMTCLLDRAAACRVLAQHQDVSQVPEAALHFKHTKWAPDGARWFVVLSNEGWRREDRSRPQVKVMFMADADGGNLRLVGSFGHHPRWLPDGSGIYAFAAGGGHRLLRWDVAGGAPTLLAELADEGHPSISPDARMVVTDCFPGSTTARILLQDLVSGQCEVLNEFHWPKVDWQQQHPPGRVCHPHPVFSDDGRRIYFNAVEDGLPILRVIDLAE